ncbi:murein DD-endopeptidase MepM/ murein hydrolase activator NlpD [Kribbella orskensis]|uniref:Murein DD-endopeptidase MepM/ murein hydrolase activator NlpD n=1 Tax=Kribbella orskensis TaxID=2512216 RepID=A0ABY2BNU2_9ACTN|nr:MULTISPECIES: M23 family metallopeptidase [Kribbella]TCN40535.1 murein DD-endopeptidase MepM/ murein hydrolase activator NlpD [Kribbella sp. VKM Ac-2500]TCO23155.1 murein DD-endopeptidase MepM/ murein hydrolase activator NlpD [Kribbella orskensis]
MVNEPLGHTLAATRLWKALVSPHHDVSDAERATPRRSPGSRRVALHRLTRRPTGRQAAQLVGLTAALAAAAGTGAVALNSSPSGAATSATSAQQNALTTARIERSQQASRDGSRTDLTLEGTRKAQATEQARIRAAKLAATATLTERRALALAATKALEAQKRAAAVKAAAAAKAAAIAKAKAKAAAAAAAAKAAAAAPKIVLPTTGYHLTARFGQAGGRWAANHTGLDFAAPIGTPVRSVMAGQVIQAEFAGAYGRQVKVRHANGTVTSYSHMSEFDVSVGDSVSAGSKVGAIGVTGNTTGPHLHFEVLPNGGPAIDPEPWLEARGINP